ncbi:MAG: T9SS type A sorting domain-containing protein, partial [Chitinophagales bacterium]
GTTCDACPTCDDGILNQDETSIDCGGTTCVPCITLNACIIGELTSPYLMEFAPNGLLYVTEWTSNGEISSVDLNTGVVTTITNNLSYPTGIAFSANGILYIVEHLNGTINSINVNTGDITVVATGLFYPTNIAFSPEGTLYVAEAIGNINSVDINTGVVTSIANGLSYPTGLAFDDDGTLYVSEHFSGEISSIDINTGIVTIITDGLDYPEGITVAADGTLYVAERGNNQLIRIDINTGNVATVTTVNSPTDVAISVNNEYYIASFDDNTISCSTIVSCNDGIQNGDETGVDCGGSNCDVCPTCGIATGLEATNLTATSVSLIWDAQQLAQEYRVAGRNVGGTARTVDVIENMFDISPLLPNTTYEWTVKVKCDGVWTDYADIQTFTTPTTTNKNIPLFDIFDDVENVLTSNVYPNPATNEVNVTFMNSAQNEVQINVLDITGRIVMTQKVQNDTWETEVILDISDLQNGYYFVEVNDGITSTISKLNVIR